ncbi:PREDICTED: branched-chain-amino-acid aminotransferase, mitochondrial [Myotis brandtii]|uniref:branched-chain-amino-acid aminotransferase, mitochondrial n=1 Tax=Myotis brandtii TaxID=109478 RepID=UPI00070474EB|nr:PREDICTED: branched-chain-amino-acid aminotransferase, mitochondrial [Myotis brandtii]
MEEGMGADSALSRGGPRRGREGLGLLQEPLLLPAGQGRGRLGQATRPVREPRAWKERVWARKLLTAPWLLGGPRRYASSSFKAADLQLEMTQKPHKKPDPNETLVFGKTFTDHMLMVEWTEEKGWNHPRIQPFQNLTLHPACSALHYSLQVARQPASVPVSLSHLFPPAVSVAGSTSLGLLLVSSFRVSIICSLRFPMFQALCWLMLRFPKISRSSSFQSGVTEGEGTASTETRCKEEPGMFGGIVGGECGAQAEEAIRDTEKLRGWDCKLGGNYGPTVFVQQEAKKKGCEQVLWLYGPDHQLTEVGTMNIFVYWTHEDGVLELVTPPLEGVILPGVVRQSLLDLAHSWGEFRVVERKITMKELLRALKEGRVREVFGSGTACQVCPVHRVLYQGQDLHIPTMDHGPDLILRFQKELKAIQVRRPVAGSPDAAGA